MTKIMKVETVLLPLQHSAVGRTLVPREGEMLYPAVVETIECPATAARKRMAERQRQVLGT
ncbi:MAG: hypothetical protein FD152_4015 [Xanthobacteraceae bacterium]|nr:MAG: hypothetical protein FD152_4015 [Xanthobacteraceae bacterium]